MIAPPEQFSSTFSIENFDLCFLGEHKATEHSYKARNNKPSDKCCDRRAEKAIKYLFDYTSVLTCNVNKLYVWNYLVKLKFMLFKNQLFSSFCIETMPCHPNLKNVQIIALLWHLKILNNHFPEFLYAQNTLWKNRIQNEIKILKSQNEKILHFGLYVTNS